MTAGRRRLRSTMVAAATVLLVPMTACSSSHTGDAVKAPTTGAGRPTGGGGSTAGGKINACTLVTAAELSKAVGVQYRSIDSDEAGSICTVTGAPTDAFTYHVTKEDGALTTWKGELATIRADDSSYTTVPGIGDRAAQGIKEFAAETHGYIVEVTGADFNNDATKRRSPGRRSS